MLAHLELISTVHNAYPFQLINVNLSLTHYGMELDVFVYLAISSKVKFAFVSGL